MSEIGSPQYPQLNQNQSPLQTLGTLAGTIGQLQQNRLFPQRQQALQNEIALQQLGISQQQLNLADQRFGIWSRVLDPLLGKEKISDSDVLGAGSDLSNTGLFTPGEIATTLYNPKDPFPFDDKGGSPEQKYEWVARHALQGHDAAARLNERLGQVGYQNTGQQTLAISTARMGGQNFRGSNTNFGPIANQLPSAGTPVVNPTTGSTGMMGTLPAGAQSPLPAGTTDVGRAPQAQGGIAPGSQMTSLPPGSTESVAAYQNLQQQVTGAPARLNMIDQAIKDLKGASTGRGTSYVNDVEALAKAQAPWMLKIIGIDPSTITNYDSANKWMTQYAQAMAAANGGHTDYQAMTTAAGNASTHIDEQAALNILHNARALEKMGKAKVLEYQRENPGNTGLNYNTWSATQWAPGADVRGFGVDEGDVKANLKEIQGLKKTDPVAYRAIVQSMAHAANNGQLNKDALAQAMRELRAGK